MGVVFDIGDLAGVWSRSWVSSMTASETFGAASAVTSTLISGSAAVLFGREAMGISFLGAGGFDGVSKMGLGSASFSSGDEGTGAKSGTIGSGVLICRVESSTGSAATPCSVFVWKAAGSSVEVTAWSIASPSSLGESTSCDTCSLCGVPDVGDAAPGRRDCLFLATVNGEKLPLLGVSTAFPFPFGEDASDLP